MAKIGKLFLDFEAGTAKFNEPIRRASKNLRGFGDRAKSTSRVVGSLNTNFRALLGPLAGIASVGAALSSTFQNLRTYEQLNAQLKTATGGATAAKVQFAGLATLAQGMPSSLEELTGSFIKLKNFGLDSSKEALVSYANTASALGKSLDQLIEAVADAATKEFERLKEFGILARNQGDTIAFTFRGTTTEVANNSQAIQEFLIGLGNTEFAGGIADQMDTLNTRLSNLSDAWFRFTTTVVDSEPAKAAIVGITNALDDLTDYFSGKQLTAKIDEARTVDVVGLEDLQAAKRLVDELNSKGRFKDPEGLAAQLERRIALLEKEATVNAEVADQMARQKKIAEGEIVLAKTLDNIERKRLPLGEQIAALRQREKELIEDIALGEAANLQAAANELETVNAQIAQMEEQMNRIEGKAKSSGASIRNFTESISRGLAEGIVLAGDLGDALARVAQRIAIDQLAGLFQGALFGGGGGLLAGAGAPAGSSGGGGILGKIGATVNNFFDVRGGNSELQEQIGGVVEVSVDTAIAKSRDLKARGAA